MVPPRKKPRSEGALGPGSEALDRGEAEEILKELGSQPISAPRPRPNPLEYPLVPRETHWKTLKDWH